MTYLHLSCFRITKPARNCRVEAEADGFQVHRSWWISADRVVKTRRDGRKIVLIMRNGLEIPVSRTHQAMVKERFLG
ncbi:hypothetical protein CRD36_13125 [Paremcibacter congregatus]|uniref:HTH LytTR-type domain-containing protein n=1 Tax=Paremcibacter congregatus TaxID=2043170 RepID=A0A2G4YP99_9PROT|nr:hypothetical protein CRD36_13125 [Paremcibacter congregatus]QDE25806.1 LytTR family transcriptional regulator [Paremcibacter congregatus]